MLAVYFPKKLISFLSIFCFCLTCLIAQEENYFDVYPVRKNHKIGYVKIYGNEAFVIVPPRYDNISDINLTWNGAGAESEPSPYRLFEKDEKVGVLNVYLEEILRSEYNRIRAVMPGYFAVEKDSLFQLVDEKGKVHLDSLFFDDIFLADKGATISETRFFVKKNGKWGLRPLEGKAVFPPRYEDISTSGTKGFYKIKKTRKQRGWYLADEKGRLLLKQGHRDILVLNEDLVAAQNITWKLYSRQADGTFKALSRATYKTVSKLNQHFAVLQPSGGDKVELWDIKGQLMLREHNVYLAVSEDREKIKQWYSPLDENYAVFHPVDKGLDAEYGHLMDWNGDNVTPLRAKFRSLGKPGHFAVFDRGGWGLVAPLRSPNPITECQFDTIYPFQNEVALTRSFDFYGLIGASDSGVDSIPCSYSMVAMVEDTFKLQFKDDIIPYVFSSSGKFEQCLINPNTTHIPPNVRRRKREAPGEERRKFYPRRNNGYWQNNLIFKKEYGPSGQMIYLAEQVPFTERVRWEKRFPYRDSLPKVFSMASSLYFTFRKPNAVSSKIFSNLPEILLHDHLIFDAEQVKQLTHYPIVGFRDFLMEANYTAYVSADGKMGLINRKGISLMAEGDVRRFTYIGPFTGGKMRVCIGGKLVADTKGEREEPDKFNLGDVNQFLRDFNMKTTKSLGKKIAPAKVFAVSEPGNPCRWGYVDNQGNLVLDVEADYALDFYEEEEPSAQIMRMNNRIAYAVKDSKGQVIREKRDADYGIITAEGEEILPTTYSGIDNYGDHYQVSVDSTPTFYFTKKGHQIFVNRTKLRPFYEGLAQFKNEEGKWGFLDTAGHVVVAPQFQMTRPFSSGMAMVVDSLDRCAFINSKGELKFTTHLVKKQQRLLGDFHEGRCWFMRDKKWGCFDPSGNEVIPPKFFYLPEAKQKKKRKGNPFPMDFSTGVAAVKVVTGDGKKWAAVIDTMGEFVVSPGNYMEISAFNNLGLASFQKNRNGLRGLMDRNGNELTTTQFSEIGEFVNGFAKVKSQHGQWGLLSRTGKLVLPMKHEDVDVFSEGRVAVKEQSYGGWSFKDTLNRTVIKGTFEQKPPPFSGGYTFVKKRGKDNQFIINKKGEIAEVRGGKPIFFSEGILGMSYSPLGEKTGKFYYADALGNNLFGSLFQEITPFQLGVARVRRVPEGRRQKEPFGAINQRGVMIVPPKFRNLHIQPDGNIIINPQRFYGIADKEGKILLEPKYDRITLMDTRWLFKVERGEEIGYVRIVGDEKIWVWELQY